ncbi:MAG: hypothetical protein ACOYD4_14770 [Solirubrobacterales bacterium]
MDEFEKHQRKQEAWRRLRAQRRRAGELRGRVVVLSLLGFALLWAVVFVQMETGNDPVLGDGSATAAVTRKAGSGTRATALPAESDASTDSELEGDESELEAEEVEFSEPELVEAEPEAVEPESEEPVEEELEPLTSSQS